MDESFEIPMFRRDGSVRAVALVDAKDFEWLSNYRWHLSTVGYCARNRARPERGTVVMHREIMGVGDADWREVEVDHINRDRLDNRRSNLRLVTCGENRQNSTPRKGCSSEYRGVCWQKKAERWQAYFHLEGKMHWLGLFDDEKEAAAVAKAARAEHMAFATD